MTIAFFDLDYTLIAVSNTRYVLKYLLEKNLIHKRQLTILRIYLWRAEHGGTLRPLLNQLAQLLSGIHEKEVIHASVKAWNTDVKQTLRHGALERIEWHKTQGHRVVVITSALHYILAPLGNDLKLDAFVGNQLHVHDKILTSDWMEPLCVHEGKAAAAERIAQTFHVSLKNCYAYSDSFHDEDFLRCVGHPYAVHPEKRLLKIATHEQWPILYW